MKKYLTICLIFAALGLAAEQAYSQTIQQFHTVSGNNSADSIYSKDLSQIEGYLYGKTYRTQSPTVRLNRIERTLFSKTHPNLKLAQRMNMVLENYRDDYYRRNNLSQYYANSSIRNRIRNNLYGQPTGFTPSLFGNTFNPTGINTYSSNNRTFRYNNFIPANMGAGIHILD